MKQKEFVDAIRACRRRLNMASFLKLLVFALAIGAGVGILFQAVAFVFPFYYVNHYALGAILLAVVTAAVAAYVKRKTMKQAALAMDSFGFKERIITAYEHLGEEGAMVQLQREDAMKQLQAHKERVKIPLLPHWKRLIWAAGLLLCMCIMMVLPAEMKDRARELHQITEEAKEKEKEIEEVVEALEELKQETLTPEQLAALQEMMESLQSSMAEYQQVDTAKSLASANEKLEYKYENMGTQLSNLAQNLQSSASISAETAEAMQALAQNMQQMSGNTPAGNQSLASNQGQSGQNNGQNGQSGNQSGQNGNQGGQNGNQGGQNGQGNNGQNGNGQGSGGQNGQNGNGQGSGQGNGQGSGQGGSGTGSGSGRGTGSSDTPHDYVSVPNAIADNENLTGNAANHDNSQYFRVQNGLSWEGTRMSHEAIIGSYEQNAYEGIAAGRYPSGMESVIKEYFASFN